MASSTPYRFIRLASLLTSLALVATACSSPSGGHASDSGAATTAASATTAGSATTAAAAATTTEPASTATTIATTAPPAPPKLTAPPLAKATSPSCGVPVSHKYNDYCEFEDPEKASQLGHPVSEDKTVSALIAAGATVDNCGDEHKKGYVAYLANSLVIYPNTKDSQTAVAKQLNTVIPGSGVNWAAGPKEDGAEPSAVAGFVTLPRKERLTRAAVAYLQVPGVAVDLNYLGTSAPNWTFKPTDAPEEYTGSASVPAPSKVGPGGKSVVVIDTPSPADNDNPKNDLLDAAYSVNMDAGGSIGWFSHSHTSANLLNAFDHGRYVQQSYYGDPDGSAWNDKPWRYNPLREDAAKSDSGAHAIREWREQRQAFLKEIRAAPIDHEPMSRRELRKLRREGLIETTPEGRIRAMQRQVVQGVITIGFLASINMITSPRFPWFLFPARRDGLANHETNARAHFD